MQVWVTELCDCAKTSHSIYSLTNPKQNSMAKRAIQPNKTKRQQPAKKRLLSLSVKKTSRRQKFIINVRPTRATSFALTVELIRSQPKTTSKPTKAKIRRKTKHGMLSKWRTARAPILIHRETLISAAIIVSCLVGVIYFGLQTFVSAQPKTVVASVEPEENPPSTPAIRNYLPRSEAVRLQIPSIGLDTRIESIGQNADGSLEVPSNYRVAGWYRFGPTPGEIGPAIIAGHVDNIRGQGVFFNLRQLQVGRKILVQRADGTTAQFAVHKVENFAQDNFPTKKVYGNVNRAELRLITCGGTFNPFKQKYTHNTVVFASLIM